MSAIRTWFVLCSEFFKARSTPLYKDPNKLKQKVESMDAALPAWDQAHGTRAEAAAHLVELGRFDPSWKDADPSSKEFRAHKLMSDVKKINRMSSSRHPVVPEHDTLTGDLDDATMSHYTNLWAAHHSTIEHSSRLGEHSDVEGARASRLPGKASKVPLRVPSLIVARRNKFMQQSGVEPFHSMDDLDVLHAGVERALQVPDRIAPGDKNRYTLMRAALKKVAKEYPESYPGLPFKPSWAAMDTTALKVMRTGAAHLGDVGFGGSAEKLTAALDRALESHQKFPFAGRKRGQAYTGGETISVPYPSLHPMGSLAQRNQQSSFSSAMAKRDAKISGSPAAASKPAKPQQPEADLSFDALHAKRESGQQMSPMEMVRYEKLKREQRMAKSLLSEWRVWRRKLA